MKLTKNGQPKQSGGKRPNSGAKPKGEAAKNGSFSFRPSKEVKEILSKQTNKTAFIERAILNFKNK